MIFRSSNAYGKYLVGNKTFINKIPAIQEATRTKEPVVFDFYNDVYSKYDWTQRPAGTLQELYKQRAQQIRDTYDYVVVHFSGGADSWTALHSFLSNGIHVDEVYTRWPFAERKYTAADYTNKSDANLTSEYEYAVIPVLEDIARRFPNTHICVDDYSEEYTQDLTESKLENGSHYMAMGTFFRFSRKSEWEKEAVRQGKSVGVVQGFEKTPVYARNGKFYAYFVDRFGAADADPERTTEGFFWSSMMPEIAIAQAHELKHYYETLATVEELKLLTTESLDSSITPRKLYIQVCYPDYNLETFQVRKPLGSVVQRHDLWVYKYNPRYYDSWQWHINENLKIVDNSFLSYGTNNMKLGLKLNISQSYCLGSFNLTIPR